jgi:hypothetical protein
MGTHRQPPKATVEKNCRRVMSYKDLWILEAVLERSRVTHIDKNKKMA